MIGEWVPKSEPGESDVLSAIEKWLRGIRWEEIDENLVLRHPTSRDGKIVELNLQEIPELLAEIRLKPRPKKGPIIVSEYTERPYMQNAFRDYWRKIALAAGLSKDARIMWGR